MSILFEPAIIGSLKVRNRFVRSATWEGMAQADGFVTPRLTALMAELARAEVGLIITGHAYVSPEGQAGQRQMGIYSDDFITSLRSMTDAVHDAGGTIVAQLAHSGCLGRPEISRTECVGPSARPEIYKSSCREAGPEEIEDIVSAFAASAVRARKAGFDGVQIHAAHGYLLSQFLSPFFNLRRDRYGGDQPARTRLLIQILRRISSKAGEDFPLLVKMNSEDFLEGGLTIEQMLETAGMLEEVGVAAVELSGGTPYSGRFNPLRQGKIDIPEKEVFYRRAAEQYSSRIGLTLILVGGIRSFDTAQSLVEDGTADFVSLSRPLICEPGLIARWKAGDRRASMCRSDNRCIKAMRRGKEMRCVTMEDAGFEVGEKGSR
jgi:2,4-dienoyl-CoA reductase-like NADH-dependent reductase (Old Yellow Enzyme family)